MPIDQISFGATAIGKTATRIGDQRNFSLGSTTKGKKEVKNLPQQSWELHSPERPKFSTIKTS